MITCAICEMTFIGPQYDATYTTHCGHVFHCHCLIKWLARSPRCPCCLSVVEKTLVYDQIPWNGKTDEEKNTPNELEEVLLLMPFSSVCYFREALIPLLNHMHHGIEPVVRSLVFLVQTLHKPISSVNDMMPILRQLNILATKKTNEFGDLVGENLYSLMFKNNSQEEEELVFNITQNVLKKRKRQKQKLLKTVIVNL